MRPAPGQVGGRRAALHSGGTMLTSGLTRQDKRQANRARILQAARKVFSQRGYLGATIEQIVGEAGLSNGAVYHSFANEEDLFFALLEEWRAELVQDLASALPRPAAPSPDSHSGTS